MTWWWRRLRLQTRRALREITGQQAPASRIARGVAAGFFATAFPLPGLQIPLSLFMAWLVRGHKAAAILPQFLSNAGTMLPFAILQFKLGTWLWPARAARVHEATGRLEAVVQAWSWRAPITSLQPLAAALADLSLDVAGPLAIGVLLTGLLMALVSYPLTVIWVSTWRARRRWRRLARRWPAAPRPVVLPGADEPPPTCAEALARYAREPHRFQRAESARLLVDGREAYPEMLAAIEAARHTVDLETYILCADRTGHRFQQALLRAAARGVQVRLLYDYIGSLGLPNRFVTELLDGGVAVAVYHPLVLTRPSWAINRRDHRKFLIVDGHITFTGGLNIGDDYAAPEEGGRGWRDTHLRLDGAEVADTALWLFEYAWNKAVPYRETATRARQFRAGMRRRWHRILHPVSTPTGDVPVAAGVCDPGGVAVRIIGNREFHQRRVIRRAYFHAIRNARRYILIENAYFIPDRGLRRVLARAVQRGVFVGVVVGRYSDVALTAYASRNLYSLLLASGVRLFEWPRPVMHAKTAVVDDAWAVVGSYNMDHRSLLHQLEAVAVVCDPVFARRLRDQTMADIAQCQEVTLAAHESRPWTRMLLESAAYQLRYWL